MLSSNGSMTILGNDRSIYLMMSLYFMKLSYLVLKKKKKNGFHETWNVQAAPLR